MVQQRRDRAERQHRKLDEYGDARELTLQCLRYLYRLIVLLYAESRPELGILPARDDAYMEGYSLDRLCELVLVELETDHARNGSHLYESLDTLLSRPTTGTPTRPNRPYVRRWCRRSAQFGGVPPVPGPRRRLLRTGRYCADQRRHPSQRTAQQVLKKRWAGQGPEGFGRVSLYAQLGINQIGAVYEGLDGVLGFYADSLYEVAKNGDPDDGTWMLPVDQADEYPDEVFVTRADPVTGAEERVLHEKGSLSSTFAVIASAAPVTPEVLTRCGQKHALAELLGTDDYAPEHGSSGITSAVDVSI